ncbi:YdcF family protein [Carboxylicivirga sp. M1479]|uniref:YdcF family protein n=1 Tax=Carboxylicivirga sp. M1479 TaxID=2594476 RepID=UPI001178BBB5|nr:YdcF family protein [Carboxylicivirga sp. M1479]TRX64258.1 YdcF family protein [Carboxylicivirga sp. M1479]
MFFLLSKILGFIIIPFNWCIALLLGARISKKYRLKKIMYTAAVSIFLLFSNTFLFQKLITNWEGPCQALNEHYKNAKPLVILGGLSSYDEMVKRIHFKDASDRLLQGILLHKNNPDRLMIISGGSAEIYFTERPEADYLNEYLINIGIDSSKVAFEKKSRNTHENAFYTAALFDSLQINKDITLITSAFHMKRAQQCFEKMGFEVSPLGTQYFSNHQALKPADYFIPSLTTLQLWPIVIKEWLGLLVYKMKGYI